MTLTKTVSLSLLFLVLACSFLGCGGGLSHANGPNPTPGTPVISSFTANPVTVTAGASTTLSWTVGNASNLQLSGISALPGNSVVVTPAQSTSYTLSATNAAGTTTQTVNVVVTGTSSIATAQVDPSSPGLAIPRSFVGFSHEWGSAQVLMGIPSAGTNPIYRQLLKNLMANGNAPIMIRIGGNSTDQTTEPTAGVTDGFAQLYKDLGAQFTLGVNLGSNNVTLATDQASTYVAAMPAGSLPAIEIGNEPDLYGGNGLRTAPYTNAQYLADFAAWRSAILPLLPSGVKLMGPSWGITNALPNLPAFLSQESVNLAIVSQHEYPGSVCNNKVNAPDFLLQDTAATSGPKAVASSVPLATATGLPFRIGELNSLSCGGQAGVSDALGSALWAMDTMFEYARRGVAGVNFHTGNGGAYAAFTFNLQHGSPNIYSIQSIRPLYYGLLFFTEAAPAGSQLLPVTFTTSANVKAWATLDSSGKVRVLIINKDTTASGVVDVQLSGYSSGTVIRLSAPSYQATSGVTLAGQTFDGSTDGTPVGIAYGETVSPVAGRYSIALPPTSAALLTVGK